MSEKIKEKLVIGFTCICMSRGCLNPVNLSINKVYCTDCYTELRAMGLL